MVLLFFEFVIRKARGHAIFVGLSHIQNGKSYEQVAQYLLQSLSAVKQWVRHYKDEGIDGVLVLVLVLGCFSTLAICLKSCL
jgi:hypothetical protein